MKLGISSYSYNQAVHAGRLTTLGIPAAAAHAGYASIDVSVVALPEGETMASIAPQLKAAAADAGIGIVNYAVGGDFLNKTIESEVERLKRELDVAAALGATSMRHDATSGFPPSHKGPAAFGDALPRLIEGYARVTEIARAMGIKTCVENHGYFCQDSERVERLICGVNSDNFGACLDIGNFMCADERCDVAVARLARYAVHAHAKDFLYKPGDMERPGEGWFPTRAGNHLRGTIVGHGVVPVAQCVSLIKKAGYDGTISIEFEGLEEALDAARLAQAYMTRVLAR